MITEQISFVCPICAWRPGGDSYETQPYHGNSNTGKAGPQMICFCQNCGLGIAYPSLTAHELEDLYESGEYWQSSRPKVFKPNIYPGQYSLAKARFKFIEPFIDELKRKESISVLDIGAGHGFFGLVAAKNNSLKLKEYYAIEADHTFRESLVKTWQKYCPQIPVRAEVSLEKINRTFDLVVLSHILEHVTNPKDFLQAAVARTRPGGFIFADVPHQDYLFKEDVFPHLHFFNRESFKKLFESSGLSVKALSCFGRDMERSPMNYRNHNKPIVKLSQIFYKMRYVLPEYFIFGFYNWYFGAGQQNRNGTWIRALAQIPKF